jgi:hypothetical protein
MRSTTSRSSPEYLTFHLEIGTDGGRCTVGLDAARGATGVPTASSTSSSVLEVSSPEPSIKSTSTTLADWFRLDLSRRLAFEFAVESKLRRLTINRDFRDSSAASVARDLFARPSACVMLLTIFAKVASGTPSNDGVAPRWAPKLPR